SQALRRPRSCRLEGWPSLSLWPWVRDASLRDAPHHEAELREQNRTQLAPPADGRFVGRAPRFEELDQLLARLVVVPFAVALDDLDQPVGRVLAPAGRIERDREIEARLMVER